MSEELLINVSPMESRVAVLDNGVVSEVYIERHNKLGLVGNIYLGTVVRVLPGMQAAFVEIGQSRTAFLHVNDMRRLPRPTVVEDKTSAPPRPPSRQEPTVLTSIPVDRSEHIAENTSKADNDISSLETGLISASIVEGEPDSLREKQSVLADETSNFQSDLHDNSLLDNDSPDKVGNAITQVEKSPTVVKECQVIEPPPS